MNHLSHIKLILIDGPTASTLAQVLPVLLLTLTVELRRTEIHRTRRFAPVLLGGFFVVFGLLETVLVLSIDGAFYPFALSDLVAALVIFGLLAIVFRLSLMHPPSGPSGDRRDEF